MSASEEKGEDKGHNPNKDNRPTNNATKPSRSMLPLFKVFMSEDAIRRCTATMRSGMLTEASAVVEYEKKLRDFTSAKYVLTCNSATSCLTIALKLLLTPQESSTWPGFDIEHDEGRSQRSVPDLLRVHRDRRPGEQRPPHRLRHADDGPGSERLLDPTAGQPADPPSLVPLPTRRGDRGADVRVRGGPASRVGSDVRRKPGSGFRSGRRTR